jgi:hypothetical protein
LKTLFTPLLICIYIWKIVKGVKVLGNILTPKPKLLMSLFNRFNLQNAKELKQSSSSTLSKTFTCMPIFTNLKHSKKKRKSFCWLDSGQNHVRRFKFMALTMTSKTLDFMPINLNMDCLVSKKDAQSTSSTQTSVPTFLGWQKATLITSKWLLKHSFASN